MSDLEEETASPEVPSPLLAPGSDDPWTPLMHAVETDDYEEVLSLLKVPQDLEYETYGKTALSQASDRRIIEALLAAGADICKISYEGRRALVGLQPFRDDNGLSSITPGQFRAGSMRRFGTKNPDVLNIAFWDAMITCGVNGWQAGQHFDVGSRFTERGVEPIWCAERNGQSITVLPDGRIVQIGGEHEDGYDPDFCIYNDVWEHRPDGSFVVYSYPEAVFPPTDFHSATLIGDAIWVVGALGYAERERGDGITPVFKLDLGTFKIEEVNVDGDGPGWINRHAAVAISQTEILIKGGTVSATYGRENRKNEGEWILDIAEKRWKQKDGTAP